MRSASDLASGLGPSLTHGNLVAARQIEHAKQHSRDEWEAMKPTIRKLYIEDFRSLRSVMRTMAENYDFHATDKMYKMRFSHWGWRKNRTKDQHPTVVRSRQSTRGTAAIQHRIQRLRTPELLNDQERKLELHSSQNVESTPSTARHNSMIRCCEAETAFSNTVHQLKSGQIHGAFQTLDRLFDSMTGGELYVHPKHLTGLWRLCDGVYNVCTWINDSDFRLLRELLCFQGQNAASSRKSASLGAHLVVSIMRSVARMSRDNPGAMKQTFRNAYQAAAESLGKKLGENHPIVLITWTDYFWYFNLPVDPAKNLAVRQQTALEEAETASGPEADITICLLHNIVFFLFYCAGDHAQAREKLSTLLERTSCRVATQASPTAYNFHIQRAHAFGSLLQGLPMLQDHGDLSQCEVVIGATIDWLRQGEGTDASIHAKMLETDLLILTDAWKEGKDLRCLTFAFANPRSAAITI
ncbi:Clr5 domain-containing protein [Xylaria acuta]|nr:Clr5 domain-containing protein [Xylaria acuta]